MAFEINDLKGILILVLFAISTVASTNINCNGRAFHCVNSTHFMICVDLGGGVSTTIDDFVIPCPASTECHENNMFECDFPEVATTPPVQVIGVNKPSDTSEPTLVTNSVTTPTSISDIFNVFKENIPATTVPIAEDVTPAVKLEVLENIMNREAVNSDSTTEASVTSSLTDSKIDIFNDNKVSNNTITTSAIDNNKHLEHAVDTSMHETVNTSSTDKSTSIDMVTSVIGLINLISTDPSSDVSTKPSSNVLASLDSSNDNIATTTEQYNTKEVTIHGIKIENVTHKLNVPIDIIISEKSVIADEVITTPALNTLVENDIYNNIENKTNEGNQTVSEQNSFGNSNNSNAIVPEITTEYLPLIKNVTVDPNPHATTDSTLVPLGLVHIINAEPKQSIPNTNDNIDTFLGDTTESTNNFNTKLENAEPKQSIPNTNDNIDTFLGDTTESTNNFNTKLETTLREKPVIVEIISTTPIAKTIIQNVLKSDTNNYSTGEMGTVDRATESNSISTFSEPTTKASTEKSFVPITTEATTVYTTETFATSEALISNDFHVEKQTKPSENINTTDLPKVVTDNFYQINGELSKNILVGTINTTEENSAVYSGTDIISHKLIDPVLVLSPSTKNPSIETTTAKILQKGYTAPGIDIANESLIGGNSVNEPFMKNLDNDTLFKNRSDPMNTTETINAVFNTSNITNGKETKPKSYPIEIATTETSQNEFTKPELEAQSELPATNSPFNVNGQNLENVEINSFLSAHTTNTPYKVTSDPGKNTVVQNLTSRSGIATNLQTSFTPEIIEHEATEGYTSMDHGTTQKTATDSVTENAEFLTQPDNLEAKVLPKILNVDQGTISVPDIVSTIIQFSSDVLGNTNISKIDKSGNMDNTSATSFVKTEDAFKEISTPASNHNVLSITPENIYTTPNMDSIKTGSLASTNTPNVADTYSVSTTDQVETSTSFPVDATLYTSNFENVTDITATTMPHHKLLSQINYSTTTATESVSNFTPSTETTAAYALDTKNIDFNTSNQTVNSTKTLNSTNGKNSVNATIHEPTEENKKDESIKIVSVLDIVNTSGNTMPIEILQPTTSNPSLSNDYIKTTDNESQASSVYVIAADNAPDYNSMYVEETSTLKNPVVILPVPTTVEKQISPTTTAVDYVTEKTNNYFSTEAIITQQNSVFSLESVSSDTTTNGFTKETVNEEVTTVKDSPFITSSTQMKPEVVIDNNITTSTESPRLSLKVMESQYSKNNTESSLPFAPITTESTQTSILTPTTPLDKKSQNLEPSIKTPISPQYVMATVNNNIPQSMPSLSIVGVTATHITTEPIDAAVFAETTQVGAINTMDPNVQSIKTTNIPQSLTPKFNNNSPQSMPSQLIVEAAAVKITTEHTYTTVIAQTTPLATTGNPNHGDFSIKSTDLPQYVTSTVKNLPQPQFIPSLSMTETSKTPESTSTKLFAQTKPLAMTVDMNLGVLSGMKSTYLPHYVSSTAGNYIPQSLPSVEVIATQMTTEPTHNTKISETTPLTTPNSNTDQDILQGITTTDLSQYETTTVIYFDTQSINDIKTKTIIDTLTTPDTMVETIKVIGDKESGTHLGGSILSAVTFNTSKVNNVGTVKSIIDHESIVVGTTFKNDKQNTSIASEKPVDNSKVEIVNHTESSWMPADVNIDNVKIKGSSIEEDDLKSPVKSGTDFKNETLQPKDGKSVDKIEYRLTTVKTDYKQADSGAPNNETQSKLIITNENKKEPIKGSLNANIEIIDLKKYKVPVDTKNIFDSYIKNNTKANNNLSLQNSTINDELEQHLLSTNHTITTEVQSHLNESDKQSNKTSTEPTLNGTSVHNLNLTSTKLNASSNNTSAITIPASVFSCTNLTRGKYADKKDCRKFYTCVGNLQPIVGICPNNTVFSEINKQCTRNLSHCVRNNQFQCLFEGRFSDFFKDNIYYICVKNRIHGFIRYTLKCQDSYHLNKASVKCEKNEEISAQSGSISETINDESKPKPKPEKTISSDDFECEKVGKFPYAIDCSKYYECTKVKDEYRRKIKKCASDEVFDKKKKKCVESDSGEC